MKRIYLFLLLAVIITACTKSENPAPSNNTAVEYRYSANNSGSYNVSYTDGNGNPTSTTFTGTSWSKTITTNQGTGFKRAYLTMNSTNANPNITGSMSILVNNKVVVQENITLNATTVGFSYYAVVFQ